MRTKESENDYRYFPDPDLIPMHFDADTIERLRASLPELPLAKKRRYQSELGLSAYDASVLVADKEWATYFESALALDADPKSLCNWMNGDLAMLLNDAGVSPTQTLVTPAHMAELLRLIQNDTISGKIAKTLLRDIFLTGQMPSSAVQEQGLVQVSDEGSVRAFVQQTLTQHTEIAEKYKAGQSNVLGFLVGQVMKLSGGKAKPDLVQRLLKEELGS
jgi:aspartyl-tRNA(Asn)/glutamyl-tRNA(Gln) amidotransferase subunit B